MIIAAFVESRKAALALGVGDPLLAGEPDRARVIAFRPAADGSGLRITDGLRVGNVVVAGPALWVAVGGTANECHEALAIVFQRFNWLGCTPCSVAN